MNPHPLLIETSQNGKVLLRAAGNWTFEQAPHIEDTIRKISSFTQPPTRIQIDIDAIQQLDTYGAWLLERLAREYRHKGAVINLGSIPKRFQSLIEAVQQVNQSPVPAATYDHGPGQWVGAMGRGVSDFSADLLAYVNMLGALLHSLGRLVKHPRDFRATSTIHHVDRVAWQAVPIILLITFLIGGIIAQQGIFHFRGFGAELYVVDMVGILILREIGVLIVAIMVAGRSGSSYTAELGSMQMREEIDALRTMGVEPVEVLILPRVIALIAALTILTFLGAMAALFGGGMVAWLYGDMNPDIYLARLREALSVTHFKVGVIKAPFMALVIGVVACTHGLRVRGSTDSLGRQTTESVVKSIFLVIVLDGLFAIFFASIGM